MYKFVFNNSVIFINYFSKIELKFLKLLNSKIFSLGSLMNIVACSPDFPLNRIWGSTIKFIFFWFNFWDSFFQSDQSKIIPKWRIGIFFSSTIFVGNSLFFASVKWAEIWWPKKLKSTHLDDSLPISHPSVFVYHCLVSSILYTGKAKWNGFNFLIEKTD